MADFMQMLSLRRRYLCALFGLVVLTCLVAYNMPLMFPKNVTIEERLHQISRLVKVDGVDCAAIFDGSESAIATARSKIETNRAPYSNSFYINLAADCEDFLYQRGYILDILTKEEEQFPLAYSLMVYKDIEMVERLLRVIYRPQNFYCIHVDSKASDEFFAAVTAVTDCFTNVFIASERIEVSESEYSVLEPELLCMKELWRYGKWKYLINLMGQEFPLRTNYELVKILTAYDGAVDVMTSANRTDPTRWRNTKPPFDLRGAQGSNHIVVNREFVDFVLHDKLAEALMNWTKETAIPEETFFSVLNANPQLGIRGTYKGEPEMTPTRPFVARYQQPCAGRFVRPVCFLTVGDLPRLANATEMFANKFFINEDRVVIGCLEEKIFNDTRDEYIGSKTFDTTYYENLDFVSNKVE